MYVTQSKNGVMINVDVNVNNQLIGVFSKTSTYGVLSPVIVIVTRYVKLINI